MAHPQTNFSSNFQGVDPPLEGYWHDDPIPCGGGNVVTDIYPNPAGVPVVVKGINALTAEDIVDKLDKTGDASNTTSTFAKATGDTSTMTSGSKLSAILTAISSFFALFKALAFKDKVSDSDINGTISNSHIASASTWNGKQNSLGINTSSGDTGKFLNERGAFATPDYPSVPSVINNLTSNSTTDALSAAQGKALNNGKVNKPIQIGATSSKPWVRVCSGTVNTWNSVALVCNIYQRGYANATALSVFVGKLIFSIFRQDDSASYPTRRNLFIDSALSINNSGVSASLVHDDSGYYELWIKCATNEGKCSILEEYSYNTAIAFSTPYTDAEFSSYISDHSYTRQIVQYYGIHLNSDSVTSVGSPTTPVYVDPNGQVQPCDVLSGSTSNFNKRFTWTYTVNQNDQYITTAVINDNTNYIAEYVEWHNANVGKLTHPPLIILSVSARTNVANAGLISLCMYRNGEGCDVIGEDYTYMGNVHGSSARNTQYFTDRPFYNGEPYYLCIRNETSNPMWTAGTILDISIRIVAHAVSVT